MEELVLFVSAFLAATIFPLSSEVALVFAVEQGMKAEIALLFASCGNLLAIVVNYFFGVFLYEKTKNKLLASKVGRATLLYGHKYGYMMLFVSWLPIIGDPITLAAGLFRTNFYLFLILAGGLRVCRYVLVLNMLQ